MRMLIPALILLWIPPWSASAAPLHHVERTDQEDAEEPPFSEEENPWEIALRAPMALPWFWNACLDGWAPWGRSSGVKYTCSVLTMGLGGTVVLAFPLAFMFSVLMTVMAAMLVVFALYAFITTGLRNGCFPKTSTVRSGTLACNSLLDVWTWAMCCSYVVCTPWLGFKLLQRGYYAIQDPIPEGAVKKKRRGGPRPKRPPEELDEGPEMSAATPSHRPAVRY